MITVISPSKSVMKQVQPTNLTMTKPLFPDKTSALVSKLQKMSQKKLTSTLGVSDTLGKLNYDRFQSWDTTARRAALWMYSGDVYNGIDAYSMNQSQIDYAQQALLIVSGLYGLARPLDAVQPYRLEMRLPFAVGRAKTLYEYWQTMLNNYLEQVADDTILLCASPEYSTAIKQALPNGVQTITPRFMQETDTGLKEKGLFAKYGRGALARWCIDNQISDPEKLKEYKGDSFVFSSELSSENEFFYIVPKNFSLKGRFVKK